MSVLSDLRQFFLPDPSPKRMERKESPPRRPPRRPSYRPYKRPGAVTKFAIETAHLPASVARQIEIDFRSALAFTYVGRADYRDTYLAAGISPDQIPEEELEELPGASGIKIPILGWELPSEQVRGIAQDWWESVATWADISLALEKDFVWTPLLADWGIENLRAVDQHPVTKKRGKFILDAAGNVLETVRQVRDTYPLAGTILDWVQYGEVRPMRRGVKLPAVKTAWLGKIKPYLAQDETGRDGTLLSYASLQQRIEDAFDTKFDAVTRDKMVKNLWRDFVGFAGEGYTFGIPERFLNVLKVVEYREIQFETRDLFETWEKSRFFRNYIWVGFLRFESERRLAVYLTKNPKVYQSLHKILSPLVSPDLADWLLKRGRVLPNRLVGAFLRRLTTQRFPSEVLAHLKGSLPSDLYREIGRKSLAELKDIFEARGYLAAHTKLGNALHVKWRKWFLPGRFLEWAGRNLTSAQQIVVSWLEEQIEAKTWIGRQLDSKVARLAGRRAFADRALMGKAALKKVPLVAGARRAAAGAALALRRRGARVLSKVVVKVAQGASKLTGPVGAILTTVATFVGGKVVKWVWEKVGGAVKAFLVGLTAVATIPASIAVALSGCGCALLLAPFLLLVFIIAPAFQGEGMGGMGPGEQLVEVRKVASPRSIDKDATGADAEVTYTIEVTNRTDKEITEGTLTDLYDARDFLPSILGGANEHIHNEDTGEGRLSWLHVTVPPNGNFSVTLKGFIQRAGEERIVVNNVGFTGDLEGESISDNALAGVIVGDPEGQPPSGWPTESGCITQGPNTSGQEASHQGQEAIDIGGAIGTPVYATHDGLAWSYTDTGTNAGGNYIYVISQPGGFYTLYAHLEPFMEEFLPDRCPVPVVAGQQIGEMGNSGHSTGPHLHYEFLYDYLGEELKMGPPYIPSAINSCIGGIECNCCFSGFNGVCDD